MLTVETCLQVEVWKLPMTETVGNLVCEGRNSNPTLTHTSDIAQGELVTQFSFKRTSICLAETSSVSQLPLWVVLRSQLTYINDVCQPFGQFQTPVNA